MSLIAQAKADWQEFTSDADAWGVLIAFKHPTTTQTATINGLHTKHHMGFDPMTGKQINSKNAHISVSEALLVAAGYPVRNANGELNLLKHIVTVKDSTGTDKKYVVRENYPDETVGMVVCILNDYKP